MLAAVTAGAGACVGAGVGDGASPPQPGTKAGQLQTLLLSVKMVLLKRAINKRSLHKDLNLRTLLSVFSSFDAFLTARATISKHSVSCWYAMNYTVFIYFEGFSQTKIVKSSSNKSLSNNSDSLCHVTHHGISRNYFVCPTKFDYR